MATATSPPRAHQLTIDGRSVSVPAGHQRLRRRAHQRHRHPHVVPSAKRNSRRRLPLVRRRHRRARSHRVLRSPRRAGNEGRNAIAKSSERAQDAPRIVDGRSSFALRAPGTFRRLRTGNARDKPPASRNRASPNAPSRAATMIPRWPSPSITTPASCAIAAFAAATKSKTILFSAAWAKAIPRASPSI